MRIAIGCDHWGRNLKQSVIKLITEAGHSYEDFGCYTTDSIDYPDIAQKVAEAVANGDFDRGILICNNGSRMQIVVIGQHQIVIIKEYMEKIPILVLHNIILVH